MSLAAPITHRAEQTIAALNISGQANRSSVKAMQLTMLRALLTTAATVSGMVDSPRG